ncbi:cellulase family glycosylhydrolase [Streptosporangium sp. G11]|uniref:cellulase family glycosylhydrolase n=1 Tax=Streptosporangium sp. G11 TaxID=3436926 RepID=UPI003EBADF24
MALCTLAVPAPAHAAFEGGSHSESQAGSRAFVTRDGSRLELNGKPFRFAGTNIYWLGLDENVGGVAYPTFFRIRDALDTAKAMGLTVVRSGMAAGGAHELAIRRGSRDYNPVAFATVDYAIAYAGSIGLRLILPMTDEWHYYAGGRRDFTAPYGLPPEAFYSDERPIADYQHYVNHVMNHVNPLTGRAYKDDPTIMAWELGNELNGMTPQWIATMSERFRAWAPRQLIAAGRQFGVDQAALNAPGVDIVDVHYYPPTAAQIQADAAAVTGAGKVYVAGEYGSPSASTDLLAPLKDDTRVSGVASWSLFGHHDRHGFVQHADGFTMHYPGDDARMRAAVDAQMAFARTTPRFVLGQPLITDIAKQAGVNVLQWRGTAGATGYRVERSAGHGRWRPAHQGLLSDNDTPWMDRHGRGEVWYRVVPFDRHGKPGRPSDPVRLRSREIVLVDPLETFDLASAHSGLTIVPGYATPDGAGPASVTWSRNRIGAVAFEVVADRRPEVEVRVGGTVLRTTVSRAGARRYHVRADAEGAAQVTFAWKGRVGGLAQATLWSADPAPVTTAPGTFQLIAPASGQAAVAPTFTWTAAPAAAHYTLVVSKRQDLSEPVIEATGLRGTSYVPPAELKPGTTYHWKVTATNVVGSTPSQSLAFTTRALPTTPATIDDYTSYPSTEALAAAYTSNTGGDPITPTLLDGAMRLDYTLSAAGYAGVIHKLTEPLDLWGHEGLQLKLDTAAANAKVTVQFVAAGRYWETTLDQQASGLIRIPFSAFAPPPWANGGTLDLTRFEEISIYLGGAGAGRITVDDIVAYPKEQP